MLFSAVYLILNEDREERAIAMKINREERVSDEMLDVANHDRQMMGCLKNFDSRWAF